MVLLLMSSVVFHFILLPQHTIQIDRHLNGKFGKRQSTSTRSKTRCPIFRNRKKKTGVGFF